MEKALCLVVVSGGVAEYFAPDFVDCRVVDLDNSAVSEAKDQVPHTDGWKALIAQAGLTEGDDFIYA